MYAHIGDADPAVYLQTLRQLADLAPSLRAVYPSHDDYPLTPTFLTAARDALEEVWGGRAADEVAGGVERYRFDGFSFLLREGWRGRVAG
ncbi:MAG: hypothetical protein IRY97_00425 [Thermomicrobiaceae bacterium]|nr:hypothetical protein [Thermomicrobiaceae bacterium]